MGGPNSRRVGLLAAAAAVLWAGSLAAQVGRGTFIAPGSTPQGDYLRGLGIAAAGIGLGTKYEAEAESIHADTMIRVDEYVNAVLRAGRDNWVKLDAASQKKQKDNYNKILKRIQDSPERKDIYSGDALNAAMNMLNKPGIDESSYRSAPMPIPPEMLRRIPFKMDEKGLVFSVQRLTARGKGKWPIAFQRDTYAVERKAFDAAIDRALLQMIDGKIDPETIADYDEAVAALSTKLAAEYAGKTSDRRYQDAQIRLREMKGATNLLKTTKIQPVLKTLENYTGKSVNDLRLFMLAHNLRFAGVDSADERAMYNELYASIDYVRRVVVPREASER